MMGASGPEAAPRLTVPLRSSTCYSWRREWGEYNRASWSRQLVRIKHSKPLADQAPEPRGWLDTRQRCEKDVGLVVPYPASGGCRLESTHAIRNVCFFDQP